MALEPIVFEKFLDGQRIAPRHIMVELDGKKTFVRVVGFDCGAGSAVAFYLGRGTALLAAGCRFEGGYGRAPQSYANLMRTSGPCLARFDQCVFDRISLSDAETRAVVFVGCTMNELIDSAPDGPKFTNCRITVIDQAKKWDGDFRRRDLNTLFPQWRERAQRR
ncbi:MAG: hypothetical protein Q7T30_02185 [Planctomycetota bacterium]|nr:hypothetical protein [Planctomycetota bacterium]